MTAARSISCATVDDTPECQVGRYDQMIRFDGITHYPGMSAPYPLSLFMSTSSKAKAETPFSKPFNFTLSTLFPPLFSPPQHLFPLLFDVY